MEQKKRILDALEHVEDGRLRLSIYRIVQMLPECTDAWQLAIWYNRLDAVLDTVWEIKLMNDNCYTRLKGMSADYHSYLKREVELSVE